MTLIFSSRTKTDNKYGGEIATCKFSGRGIKPAGAQVLRSISAVGNDSWRAGFLSGMAGCGDHGTDRSVSLCLASATFFVGLVILLSSLIGMMCSP